MTDAAQDEIEAQSRRCIATGDRPIRPEFFGNEGVSGFVKADSLFASHTKSFAFWAGWRDAP